MAATALIALLGACGGQGRSPSPQEAQQGRVVFTHSCAGCHTLTGHDTQTPGGDLAIARLSVADLASFARAMPIRLSAADLQAVANYIHTVTIRRARQ